MQLSAGPVDEPGLGCTMAPLWPRNELRAGIQQQAEACAQPEPTLCRPALQTHSIHRETPETPPQKTTANDLNTPCKPLRMRWDLLPNDHQTTGRSHDRSRKCC